MIASTCAVDHPAMSEELSNPYQKSDFLKDNSRSNDLKLSNSDTIMQGQKPYLYPPEFGRPSDISSVVLDEADSVPLDERSADPNPATPSTL